MPRDFALACRGLARLRRANNLFCCVKNALCAFFTQQNKEDAVWTLRLAQGPHRILLQANSAGASKQT